MINTHAVGDVTIVELDQGAVNALDLELVEAITTTLGRIDGPIVLTGRGRAFSAGVDLRRIVEDGDDYIERFLHALSRAFNAVFTFPHPTVAAVNGHAIAGGCVIALACDLRLMSAGTIGLTELPVGVAFPRIALEIVRYALGPLAAKTVLQGEAVGRQEALRLGMVDEVVEASELLERSTDTAVKLARTPATLYARTKQDLHAPALSAVASEPEGALQVWTAPETKARLEEFLASLSRGSRPTDH
ncbi:MAG TPA: enoyl-CoA hydratase/isomerase family protein [Mycobacteriales bacterium]|nr:enoyl-CoA hydratase/isomerase family protein [Mycobacteriales bacterium]